MREPLKPGIDVRTIRQPINDAFAATPNEIIAQGAATSKDGRRVSFSVVGEDLFYLRLNAKDTSNTTIKYGWTMVQQDRDTGTWANSPRLGNTTDDSYAVELNNTDLTVGTAKRYPARLNPQSGRVTFRDATGGGGGVTGNITGDETVLMILGTYDEYANCPGVPAKPPTTFTNLPCSDTRSETLCVPAYAYAVYQRCGYVWNKIGDTRSFGVWANELNGGTTSAWRRFFMPRWGGDLDPTTGIPNSGAECMGVAFMGYSSQGALTCDCPNWFTGAGCLKITVKWISEPGSKPADCPQDCWDLMTGRWGTEESTEIIYDDFGCVLQGEIGTFPISIIWQDRPRTDCFWGPDVFDPCNPCGGFSKFTLGINSSSSACGGAGNFWLAFDLDSEELADLICNCGDPILATFRSVSGPCGNLVEYIEVSCCDGEGEGGGGEGGGGPGPEEP
jgi:hypothetical protein